MGLSNSHKKSTKNVAWKLVLGPFVFLRIICKKEFEELYMPVLTYFDSFAITFLTVCLSQKKNYNRGCT